VCIRYHGVSTEPFPSNDGIFMEPLPSKDRGIFTEPLPSNGKLKAADSQSEKSDTALI
jgi:hypothetical protein